MMTPAKLSSIVIAMALALSACNGLGEITPSINNRTITVTADVSPQTKAGYGTEVLPDKFVMDIIQGEDEYNYYLVEMTKTTEGGNQYLAPADMNMVWKNDSYSAEIKAMTVPYGFISVDPDNSMIVSVSLEQNNPDNVIASDLLGATNDEDGGIVVDEGAISIEFRHLLSKFDIKYEFGPEFSENSVAVNSITLKNICVKGGYSYADMDYAATGLAYDDIVMCIDSNNRKAEAIFYPYVPAEPIILVINASIDGTAYDFSCPIVAKTDKGFVGGKRYTMTVTIRGTMVSATSATIAQGWDTETDEQSFVTK